MTTIRRWLLNAAALTQPPPGVHHGSLVGDKFACMACGRLLNAPEWAMPCPGEDVTPGEGRTT